MIDPRFWNQVYTVRQLAERLQTDESTIWTWLACYRIAVPPYRHGDTVLWLRIWIEKWIEAGMPAVMGMVEHRRELNRLLAGALGCPPPEENIPSAYPIVGMTGDGSTIRVEDQLTEEQETGCPTQR